MKGQLAGQARPGNVILNVNKEVFRVFHAFHYMQLSDVYLYFPG